MFPGGGLKNVLATLCFVSFVDYHIGRIDGADIANNIFYVLIVKRIAGTRKFGQCSSMPPERPNDTLATRICNHSQMLLPTHKTSLFKELSFKKAPTVTIGAALIKYH